jgi:hypothetical protein
MLMEAGTSKICDLINCLIVMDLVKIEDSQAICDTLDINSRRKITRDMLYHDLLENGTRVMVEGRELYSRIFTFNRYKDCKFDDSFGSPINDVDFSVMLDKDIWNYIYGEYFLNCRLSTELMGFGLINI